jgi:photosystem II stability/assembly factor-like uncharacterized protein
MQDAKKEMDEVAAKQERVEQIVAPRDNETNQAGLNSAGVVAGRVAESGPSNAANVSNVYTANNNAAPAAAVAKKQKLDAAPRQEIGSESLGYVQAAPAAAPAARAHWRISTDGKVERSYGSDAWSPVLTDTGASFQVVSVIGNVVWAGGSHGALYASRDGGTNWIPIKIATTADITSIHFDDELHGVLRTSDGKTWKSMDGGNTWSLQ